jgi:hypothetical protein
MYDPAAHPNAAASLQLLKKDLAELVGLCQGSFAA